MQAKTAHDLVRMADEIRALTTQRNEIANLQQQAARIVWACHHTLQAYEGHTNADQAFIAQVVAMKASAERKCRQCDEWLSKWSPKLESMVEIFNNQE